MSRGNIWEYDAPQDDRTKALAAIKFCMRQFERRGSCAPLLPGVLNIGPREDYLFDVFMSIPMIVQSEKDKIEMSVRHGPTIVVRQYASYQNYSTPGSAYSGSLRWWWCGEKMWYPAFWARQLEWLHAIIAEQHDWGQFNIRLRFIPPIAKIIFEYLFGVFFECADFESKLANELDKT